MLEVESFLPFVPLALIVVGVVFMHLRLRSKTSLALILSLVSIVALGALYSPLSKLYMDRFVDVPPTSTSATAPSMTSNAEAFRQMGAQVTFEKTYGWILFALVCVFCMCFLLSARSIPGTMKSDGRHPGESRDPGSKSDV